MAKRFSPEFKQQAIDYALLRFITIEAEDILQTAG